MAAERLLPQGRILASTPPRNPVWLTPALALWLGDIALAWADSTATNPDNPIRVAWGPLPTASDPFVPTLNVLTGLVAPSGEIAITEVGGSLLVLWVDDSSSLQAVPLTTAGV